MKKTKSKLNSRKRAPNLDSSRVNEIVDLIERWTRVKLTWEFLVDAIEVKTAARYTRQALSKHTAIQRAYEIKNEMLSTAHKGRRSTSITDLDAAYQTIERQKIELRRLAHVETTLLEQFARWAYNASLEGYDTAKLDKYVPPVNRDTSKSDRKHTRKK